jgi:putative ABC transport system permease protein
MLLTLSTLIAASSSRGTWIAAAVSVALVLGLLMGVKIPLRYLVRNLTVRWRTTLMTALAFVMVISLLTVMMAFVNGMYHLTQASGQPGNVMVMADGATDESFSNLVAPDMADLENQPGIVRENNRPLCSRETYLVVTQPLENPLPGRPKRRFLQVRGMDDSAMAGRVHGLDLYPGGNWLSEAGVREGRAKGRGRRQRIDRPAADRGRRWRRRRPCAGRRQKTHRRLGPAPRTA